MKKILLLVGLAALLGAGCATQSPTSSRMNHMGSMSASSPSAADDAMREHCKMMPEMAACSNYRDQDTHASIPVTGIDRSTAGLARAKVQDVVTVANQGSYALSADFVQKNIGGKSIRMLAYNGQLPGPILRVKQGDAITINFTNNLDQPTTVHWHGVRVDNANDGVPNMTQSPVNPGGTYAYHLKFPDAGLYWYHPHLREDYQQELGMYGLIWVEPADATTFAPVNTEALIAVDDILLSGADISPFDAVRISHTLMGRFGNTMLINGQTTYSLEANNGDVVRFGFANTANTRVFKLAIPGAKMKLVGGDSGGYAHDQWVENITLAPSERALVDVQFTKPGTYELKHVGPTQYTLGTIRVSNTRTHRDYSTAFNTLQDRSSQFRDLLSYVTKAPDVKLDLTIEMPGMMGNMQMNGMMNHGASDEGIEWEDSMAMMNQSSNDRSLHWLIRDTKTGLDNDKIGYTFQRGDKITIRIVNDKNSMHPMQHPIHFHGNRFIVLATNGVKNTNPVWKDTVLVPIGATVDILLDASNPGTWMAHCHIAEHLQDGMMFNYSIQ